MKQVWLAEVLLIAIFFGINCQKEIYYDTGNTNNSDNNNNSGPDNNNNSSLDDDWTWEFLGKPLGDSQILTISIHPENDKLWFVTSFNGIYVTRNGGQTWTNYLSGISGALVINPNNQSHIYSSSGNSMYASKDYGESWKLLYTFPRHIVSILVSKVDNSIYAGLAWDDDPMPNGIYKSIDGGKSWKYYSYKVSAKGLIPWDIEEDPINKKIYIATEIYDHPQPYHPPFLRSSDGGQTWQDISSSLPWHAVKIQVHPKTRDVYALLEGPGMYYSKDFGDHWEYLECPYILDFIIDKNKPQRFFGGNQVYLSLNGGVFQSNDAGKSYNPPIGLVGQIAGSLCLDEKSNALYVASFNSGIFRGK